MRTRYKPARATRDFGRLRVNASPPLPNRCPAGYDPAYCDTQWRKSSAIDERFYVCVNCGKQGRKEAG